MCALFALSVTLLSADDSSVVSDPMTDFSQLRTFSFRAQQVESRRPELDNPLFLKSVAAAIRTALIARGLTASTNRPDLLVDFTIVGEEFGDVERRLLRRVPGGPVASRRPIRIAEGTLVIDIFRRTGSDPIWRGIYRDDERTGSKLVRRIPEDAKKLLRRYPKLTK